MPYSASQPYASLKSPAAKTWPGRVVETQCRRREEPKAEPLGQLRQGSEPHVRPPRAYSGGATRGHPRHAAWYDDFDRRESVAPTHGGDGVGEVSGDAIGRSTGRGGAGGAGHGRKLVLGCDSGPGLARQVPGSHMALYVELSGGGSDRYADTWWSEPQAVDYWEMDVDFKELHDHDVREDGSLVILRTTVRSFRGRLNDGWRPYSGPEAVRRYARDAWANVRKDDSSEHYPDHPRVQDDY